MTGSIPRAVMILKALAQGRDRLVDIATSRNLSKSTTHRLLSTMVQTGLVSQDPLSRRYFLGPLFLNLATNSSVTHQNLVLAAHEQMAELHRRTDETVSLHIHMGAVRISLEEMASTQNIKFTSGKGDIAPVYAGAPGKALLAQLSPEELEALLAHIDLKKEGPKTITSKPLLKKELAAIQKQGYALSYSERIPGSSCLSAPIYGYVTPAALSIFGPDYRFQPDDAELIEAITQGVHEISNSLNPSTRGRR